MTRRFIAPVCAYAVLLVLSATAAAAPQSVPDGPWLQESQHLSLERLHSYEELGSELARIEQSSHGRVDVTVAGQSNEGRNIYLAKAGSGPIPVLFITQQHGNEPLGTEAALALLRNIGQSGHPEVRQMLERLTILVIPRVNPDGGARFWRQNFDPVLEPGAPTDFWTAGRGYDINRWHLPELAPADNPVPEAATVRRVFDAYHPAIMLDLHHQGSYVAEDGELIRTSMFWPRSDVQGGGITQDAIDRSKQVAWLMASTLAHYGYAKISQYPGGPERGIARNAYGLLGAASVLVEMRGDIGQKSSGYLMRTFYAAMGSVLEAATEGTLAGIDPALADTIPLRGPEIDDPNDE
jgi:hypothetical protein